MSVDVVNGRIQTIHHRDVEDVVVVLRLPILRLRGPGHAGCAADRAGKQWKRFCVGMKLYGLGRQPSRHAW